MQHLILKQFDLIGIKLDEALASGAWSLWVSFLAPSKFLELRDSLGHGPPSVRHEHSPGRRRRHRDNETMW